MSLARLELIGLRARVAASAHAPYLGLEGTVVDETQGTLTLEVGSRELMVPKEGQEFEFTLEDGSKERLRGQDLAHRPEDRTRKARPRQDKRRETPR